MPTIYKTIEKVLILHDLDLFSLASTEQLGELAMVCQERAVEKGSVLFQPGDPGNMLFILVRGELLLTSNACSQSIQGAACLEFWNFFSGREHDARVEAVQDCVLLELCHDDFRDIVNAAPELSLAILQYLAEQGRALSEAACGGETRSPDNRAAPPPKWS